jgi:hypothetical protein
MIFEVTYDIRKSVKTVLFALLANNHYFEAPCGCFFFLTTPLVSIDAVSNLEGVNYKFRRNSTIDSFKIYINKRGNRNDR